MPIKNIAEPGRVGPDFLWGTATAGHQVEGQNTNSDWWWFEHMPNSPVPEPSGDACDSWSRYPEDVGLVRSLGLNAFRFSVEWSRVEPAEGEFSNAALGHYRRVVAACCESGITPVVTFHHVSLPAWIGQHGGWMWQRTPELFARYCARTAAALGDALDMVITINEPDLCVNFGYRQGIFPSPHAPDAPCGPGDKAAALAAVNLADGHRRGREAIRASAPHVRVGQSLAVQEWGATPGFEAVLQRLQQDWEGDFFAQSEGDDFLGVQCYTRLWAGPVGEAGDLPAGATPNPVFMMYPPGTRRTAYGYEFRPEALEAALKRAASATGLPLLVTENGIATDDDAERVEFLHGAITALGRAMADGVNVLGYLHWSLLDNFEWNQGYTMRFGLVEVDRHTFQRRPKPSAEVLGHYARRGVYPSQPETQPREVLHHVGTRIQHSACAGNTRNVIARSRPGGDARRPLRRAIHRLDGLGLGQRGYPVDAGRPRDQQR